MCPGLPGDSGTTTVVGTLPDKAHDATYDSRGFRGALPWNTTLISKELFGPPSPFLPENSYTEVYEVPNPSVVSGQLLCVTFELNYLPN